MNDRRAVLTALGFVHFPPATAGLRALRAWLDSWTGLGHVIVGMERQGFSVSITRLDDHCRARFTTHPMISDDGWGAAQRAAWMVMKRTAT